MGFSGQCAKDAGEVVASSRLSFPIGAGLLEVRDDRGLFNTSSCSVEVQGRAGIRS